MIIDNLPARVVVTIISAISIARRANKNCPDFLELLDEAEYRVRSARSEEEKDYKPGVEGGNQPESNLTYTVLKERGEMV